VCHVRCGAGAACSAIRYQSLSVSRAGVATRASRSSACPLVHPPLPTTNPHGKTESINLRFEIHPARGSNLTLYNLRSPLILAQNQGLAKMTNWSFRKGWWHPGRACPKLPQCCSLRAYSVGLQAAPRDPMRARMQPPHTVEYEGFVPPKIGGVLDHICTT